MTAPDRTDQKVRKERWSRFQDWFLGLCLGLGLGVLLEHFWGAP
jgi:hypothetical protein